MLISKNGMLKGKDKLVIDEPSEILSFTTELPEDTIFYCEFKFGDYSSINHLVFIEKTPDNLNLFQTIYSATPEAIASDKVILTIHTSIGADIVSSQPVELHLDREKLATYNIVKHQDVLFALTKEIAEIRQQLTQYAKGYIQPITPQLNKKLMKKGMIYAVLDDQGNCGYIYPLYDSVKSINHKKSVDGNVDLLLKDIPGLKAATLEQTLKNQAAATRAVNQALIDLTEVVKQLTKDMKEIKTELALSRNADII